MSRDLWQEIEKLKQKTQNIERSVSQQPAKIGSVPEIKIGEVHSVDTSGSTPVYKLLERTVNAAETQAYLEVEELNPSYIKRVLKVGDIVAFSTDKNGVRYILPEQPESLIIRDTSGSAGKNIDVNESGTASNPASQETLSTNVHEPSGMYVDSTDSRKTGRTYLGKKSAGAY
ncbi:MAG: hypothetical protein MI923_21065, partial [Phycisphaerales bacterium]|nr:hypothetical protein [Phycisphaerales bacterium]